MAHLQYDAKSERYRIRFRYAGQEYKRFNHTVKTELRPPSCCLGSPNWASPPSLRKRRL